MCASNELDDDKAELTRLACALHARPCRCSGGLSAALATVLTSVAASGRFCRRQSVCFISKLSKRRGQGFARAHSLKVAGAQTCCGAQCANLASDTELAKFELATFAVRELQSATALKFELQTQAKVRILVQRIVFCPHFCTGAVLCVTGKKSRAFNVTRSAANFVVQKQTNSTS